MKPAPNHPWKQSFKESIPKAPRPLFKHQQDIIDADPKKCGLFLGTGGGKTLTALSLATGDTLIVMPKTQFLDENWERELLKIEHNHLNQVRCISKEAFKRDHKTLPSYETVIIDEAHTVLGVTPNIRWRNKKPIPKASQIFEAVWMYLERTKPSRLYLATATPARNPMSIWAAGALLGKSWNWEAFRSAFYMRLPMPGREVWQPRKDAETKELLVKYTKNIGFVGRLEDWFDVPEQTDREIHCPLTRAQESRIRELPLEHPEPIVLIGKEHQVEQGLLMKEASLETTKIEAITDLLEEFPKVLIFARYLGQIKLIAEYLKAHGIEIFTLSGETKNRKEVIEKAEASKRCAIIAQAQISTGYELPSFRCTVFASMSYSHVDHVQAKGRTLRANKLNKNLYVYLIAGEVDAAVLKCMKDHRDFDERLYAERSQLPDKV